MDSLTQMVLGAAVGEAALGKKIGNRAMVWGAIAGTIPDLDVIANVFMDPIDALAFHRGFTHSIVFCLGAAAFMGWIMPKFYMSRFHKPAAISGWIILGLLISGGLFFSGSISPIKSIIAVSILALFILVVRKKYLGPGYSQVVNASTRDWQWLFWWSFITHPFLDCFTTYGTQIFQPFSDKRVSFDNIAVADPMYTLPLMIFLLIALAYPFTRRVRSILNWTGIALSSFYMLLTIVNKQYIASVFTRTLAEKGVEYSRFMTTPSILNNVLWSGIAEGDSTYYFGQFSIFDKTEAFKINEISKNHVLVENDLETDHTLSTLRWFSNGYFHVESDAAGKLTWYDLRFGSFKLSPAHKEEFVFRFDLEKKGGNYILNDQPTRPRDGDMNAMMSALWQRVKGI